MTAANVREREGAHGLLSRVLVWFIWLRRMWVDGGYSGPDFAAWVRTIRPKVKVEVFKRTDVVSGLKVLPKLWIVERTFGWLMSHRRVVRDYERCETSAESWVYIAMIQIQLRRFA